jgi:hypothetical protein
MAEGRRSGAGPPLALAHEPGRDFRDLADEVESCQGKEWGAELACILCEASRRGGCFLEGGATVVRIVVESHERGWCSKRKEIPSGRCLTGPNQKALEMPAGQRRECESSRAPVCAPSFWSGPLPESRGRFGWDA